ncbi:MAG: glycosyltransferase family 39 protein [candidate division KSB1 bacterium]|nr:glycosyltransferase family 39 protein [candidate division KSB1 bacterium]MDZ7305326.1 glycosyltransferase family 39 protein [candidate division KSB1 bacterium]
MNSQHNEKIKEFGRLAGIFILGLAFRLVLMNWRFAIGFDEPHYLQLGAAAALHGWENLLHPYWPPMYPALIALLSVFSHNFELVGRLVSVITGTAAIIPVYILSKELFGARTGLLSAFLLALFPAFAFDSTNTLSESTYTFFSVSAVAAGWFALKNRSVWKAALAGALFGMSYLTKPEGLGYVCVYLILATILFIFHWTRDRQLALMKIMFVTVAATLFCASPYLTYLRHTTGDWTISGKYKVNRFDLNAINRLSPDNQTSPLDMAYHLGNFHEYDVDTHAGRDGRASDWASLAKTMAENFYKALRFAIPGVITAPMFFLMALGLAGSHWTWAHAKLHLYLLSFVVFFWLIVIPFFHINDRYFVPLLPFCFVWIGQGTVILSKRLCHLLRVSPIKIFSYASARWGMTLTAALLIVLSFLPELGKVIGRSRFSRDFWADAIELKEAGEWLKANAGCTPVLMSYNKAVDFYAGQFDIRKTATFSRDSLDRVLEYAAHRRVDYLVIDERYQEVLPNLAGLSNRTEVPEVLKPVYDHISVSGLRVIIYQLQPVLKTN